MPERQRGTRGEDGLVDNMRAMFVVMPQLAQQNTLTWQQQSALSHVHAWPLLPSSSPHATPAGQLNHAHNESCAEVNELQPVHGRCHVSLLFPYGEASCQR